MFNARKSLLKMYEEWSECERCELSTYRKGVIPGNGPKGQIMVVMRSPTWKTEEEQFTDGEELLRGLLNHAGVLGNVYFTYATACRSCSAILDPETNKPKTRTLYGGRVVPMLRDVPPTTSQVRSCAPRLQEELYIVDPLVILACGESAIHSLIGKSASVSSMIGHPQHIEIPGNGVTPKLTEKKHQWFRKVGGERLYPTTPTPVRYLMIPTHDPAYALTFASDTRHTSPAMELKCHVDQLAAVLNHSLRDGYVPENQEPDNAQDYQDFSEDLDV